MTSEDVFSAITDAMRERFPNLRAEVDAVARDPVRERWVATVRLTAENGNVCFEFKAWAPIAGRATGGLAQALGVPLAPVVDELPRVRERARIALVGAEKAVEILREIAGEE